MDTPKDSKELDQWLSNGREWLTERWRAANNNFRLLYLPMDTPHPKWKWFEYYCPKCGYRLVKENFGYAPSYYLCVVCHYEHMDGGEPGVYVGGGVL